MTDAEKLNRIKLLSNESLDEFSDEVLMEYIKMAGEEILAWAFVTPPDAVPFRFENIQCMAVIAGFNQIGAEGSVSYNANGMVRGFSYDSMIGFIHANTPVRVDVS